MADSQTINRRPSNNHW